VSDEGPRFDDLVDDDVTGAERARLQRVHDLLVAAGPPPELPESLASVPGSPKRRSDPELPRFPRRRLAATIVLAAALALATFGAGYLLGDRAAEGDAFSVDFVVALRGTDEAPAARASLAVGVQDEDGNWPMRMTVRDLPELPNDGRYELFLTRKGQLADSCGTFWVGGEETVVPLNAPYRLRTYDGWVVVRAGTDDVVLETTA
jgi:hypothetical protein